MLFEESLIISWLRKELRDVSYCPLTCCFGCEHSDQNLHSLPSCLVFLWICQKLFAMKHIKATEASETDNRSWLD